MTIKQISIFLENKKGRLAQVTSILEENNIDMSAISIADTTNFGILRIIVDKPFEAVEALRKEGFTVNKTDVIAVEVPDSPGGLNKVLNKINEAEISVEYLYSFVRRPSECALILFKVDDIDKTIEFLEKDNIKILTPDEIRVL